MKRPGSTPRFLAASSLGRTVARLVEQDRPYRGDRTRHRPGRAVVLVMRKLARLDDHVEARLQLDVEPVTVAPHGAAHPDPGQVASDRRDIDEPGKRIGAVEDDRGDIERLDRRQQLLGVGAIPADVGDADLDRPGYVVGRVTTLVDQMRPCGARDEDRLDIARHALGDGHQAGDVAEPYPVGRDEQQALSRGYPARFHRTGSPTRCRQLRALHAGAAIAPPSAPASEAIRAPRRAASSALHRSPARTLPRPACGLLRIAVRMRRAMQGSGRSPPARHSLPCRPRRPRTAVRMRGRARSRRRSPSPRQCSRRTLRPTACCENRRRSRARTGTRTRPRKTAGAASSSRARAEFRVGSRRAP